MTRVVTWGGRQQSTFLIAIVFVLILVLMTFAACLNSIAPKPAASPTPSSTPSPTITALPTNAAQAAPVVAFPRSTPALPELSSGEAIAIVQNFLRGEAQTAAARMELSKIYDSKWEAVYKGNGEWGVKGVGSWSLFEKTKTVQPADDPAKGFMKVLVNASLSPSSTPTTAPTPTPQPTPSPTPTPQPQPSDRRQGLVPLHSFVAAPDYNPAVDIRQIVQVQTQIDRIFKDRYGIPYYGGLPELSKLYEPHDINKLQTALKDLRSLTQWKYVLNKFDCSNMSALTQFYLAGAGFKTVIVVGEDPNNFDGHAWVVVLISSPAPEAIPIETTTPGGPAIPNKGQGWSYTARGITGTQTYDDYLTKGWAVQDIYQAVGWAQTHFGETLGPDNEFNWWDTTQVDWSPVHRSAPAPTPGIPTPTIVPSALTPIPGRPAAVTVTPESALTGTTVTVTGQSFTPNGTIPNVGIIIGGIVGNTAPVFISADGSFSYSFILTSDLPAGANTVQVTDMTGRRASGLLIVTKAQVPIPPSLTVTPTSTTPGTWVTVTGHNFTPYATVRPADILLGKTPSTGYSYNVDSTGNIAFLLGMTTDRSPGTYSIVVTDSSGKRASATVTVIVTAAVTVSPTLVTSGSAVTLIGSGFTPYGTITAGAITVGGVSINTQAISLDANGGFTYLFHFTRGWKGTYNIAVIDSAGRQASTTVTVSMPVTLNVSPTSVPTGFPVTLIGSGFTSYGSILAGGVSVGGVSFNTQPISIDANGSFTYAFSFTSGNGAYNVVVTDSAGKQASTKVTVIAAAALKVSPTVVTTGSAVTLTGSGFTPYGTVPAGTITVGGVTLNTQAITLDANGGFTYIFYFTSGWGGAYSIVVTDSTGKRASVTVTVTP